MFQESYRRYDYDSNVGLIGRTEQIEDYLDEKFSSVSVDPNLVESAIAMGMDKSMCQINCQFCATNEHIEHAKNEIVCKMNCQPPVTPCPCNIATKEDVRKAVTDINSHTDEKFNEANFLKQFADLNEQIKKIQK